MLFGNMNIILLRNIKQNNLEIKNSTNINTPDQTNSININKKIDFFFLKNNLVDSCVVSVNYFFRAGFKSKLVNLFNYNTGWLLFIYVNSFRFKFSQLNDLLNLNELSKDINNNLFSFNNLNILVKHVRLSRKIRKYTKNKIRYRSFLVTLRSRQILGTTLRMWNLIYLNMNSSYRLKSFIINNLIWNKLLVLDDSLLEENENNLNVDNNFSVIDVDYVNTPQKIQFQMFDDMVHRK